MRSDFTPDPQKGPLFGAARDKLKFNSFNQKYLDKVFVPCATSYDVIQEVGSAAPKVHF